MGAETAFGQELRRLRTAHGLSLAQLSARTHYSKGYLSNIENGRKSASPDLARRLEEVLDAKGVLLPFVEDAEEGPCPYRGLAAFGPEDARWFFGRDRTTAALLSQAVDSVRIGMPLVVFGVSGAGKSSLLRAGLVPAVARGALPVTGSARWPALVMTPTAHPMAALARGVAQALDAPAREGPAPRSWREALPPGPPDVRLVLVVDQFEELFTLCEDEAERLAFVRALREAAALDRAGQASALVVLGVRADYYDRCLAHPELLGAVQQNQFALGAMSRSELVEAIIAPARVARVNLEHGLVELMLRDLGVVPGAEHERTSYDPGALPLLSHALLVTWQQRRDHDLTVAAYQRTGGIHGAVAATAERCFNRLDTDAQQAARRLLLRLVRVGEQGEVLRQRADRDRLLAEAADASALRVAMESFTAARLLTLGQDTVEITHEALLSAWPRLRRWLEADRAGLRVRQRLIDSAETWEEQGRDRALTQRGAPLAVMSDWATHHPEELTRVEQDFLTASNREEHREVRRLRRLVAMLSVLFLLALAATVYAVRTQHDVTAQRNLAISRKVAIEASELRPSNPELAAQLSLAAYRLAPTVEARSSLLGAYATPHATFLTSGPELVESVALSPDARTLASTGRDRVARLWDLSDPSSPKALATLTGHTDTVLAAAFSADGRLLATAGRDRAVHLWDVADRSAPASLGVIRDHGDAVRAVSFSSRGPVLATASHDRTVRLWDLADPRSPRPLATVRDHTDAVLAATFSPDGNLLATVGKDRVILLWDVSSGQSPRVLSGLRDQADLVASFTPDGRLLATAGQDRTVRLWNVENPRQVQAVSTLSGHIDVIRALTVSRDGSMIATASDERAVRLWDIRDPRRPNALAVLTGHTDAITSLVFGGDGRFLVSASADNTARIWEITGPVLAAHTEAVFAVAFSPDGRILATTSDDRTVRLHDVTNPRRPLPVATLAGHQDTVRHATFSRDGRLLATSSWDQTARLWDVSDPRQAREVATVRGHTSSVRWVAFSPDSQLLLTGGDDRTGRLWDVRDPRSPTPLGVLTGHTDTVRSVDFRKDGRVAVTASWDGTARLWDVADPRQPQPLGVLSGHEKAMRSVAFHPGGDVVATTSWDHTVRLWDVSDPRRPGSLSTMTGHTAIVFGAAFDPDGRTLATSGDDGTIRLWDVSDPRHPASLAILTEHLAAVFAVAFSPDGHTLATTSQDRTTRLWKTDVDRATDHVCSIVRTPLSREEWKHYFTEIDYDRPCPHR
ncbi:nSTAND1 domain-containing NTPase [Streptoalloteichus hindustanus]|uniref:WD40 repeat n=1 Tax=Streptoalloteichus hindustanus TaxID=2017 RepID=A0A1M5ET77_STRHI|nr:helix-turn-helix domain-containing protein [Streptoalloteichus hindustanus]SHF82374.1 WD40 repeat [Streptoalloteichus hindustanus]